MGGGSGVPCGRRRARQSRGVRGGGLGEQLYLARARVGRCQHTAFRFAFLERPFAYGLGVGLLGQRIRQRVRFDLGLCRKGFQRVGHRLQFQQGDEFQDGCRHRRKYFHFGSNSTLHVYEAQVGYDFGFLAVNWYTNIGGNDGLKKDGKRAYSSYVSLSAPFRLGGLDWDATVAAVPWETSFYNGGCSGFAVSEVALQAAKDIKITESFALPLFAKVTWNPASENAYFTAGLSF